MSSNFGVFEGADYYLVQFSVGLSAALQRRVERIVGGSGALQHYIPGRTLIVYVENEDIFRQIVSMSAHVRLVEKLPAVSRSIDFESAINQLQHTYKDFFRHKVNETETSILGTPVNIDDHLNPNAYARDKSGAVVVNLRVIGHNVSFSALKESAQSNCRTAVQLNVDNTTPTNNNAAANHAGGGNDQLLLSNVHCDDAARVSKALSERVSGILWIELRSPMHALNHWSAPTLWNGVQIASGASDFVGGNLPLTGAKQLLSVSDTGVETDSCFFRHSARNDRLVPLTSTQQVPQDTQHRTVRAYWSGVGGDFRDVGNSAASGHGTHVCGTALGSAHNSDASNGGADEASGFNGIAPGARLVFTDLMPSNGDGFLYVPLQIGPTIFQFSQDCGAYIHSASWGGDAQQRYTSDEASVDEFAYHNRRFLPIFAAGNDGPRQPSISSPAMAKNALTVGATMNGYEAYELATGSRASDRSQYSVEWLARFSARGDVLLPFRKPDIVAPGGAYVWSANALNQPLSGACTPLARAVAGLQGTSMATPLVAGGALLVSEYFAEQHYADVANVYEDSYAQLNLQTPTASLIRATLVAASRPLLGVFPRQRFGSTQQRIDASGHGRPVLARVLRMDDQQSSSPTDLVDNNVFVVLSNEQPTAAVSRTTSMNWCITIDAHNSDVEQESEVVIVMAYADYPSSPLARAALVNNLRLQVTDSRGTDYLVNETERDEKRSTIERVRVERDSREPLHLQVRVSVPELEVGDRETYSLVLLVEKHVDGSLVRVTGPHSNSDCTLCSLDRNGMERESFIDSKNCAVCGNGVVESPAEQCDSEACCDSDTCRWLHDNSPCVIEASGCRLRGKCAPPDANSGSSTNLQSIDTPFVDEQQHCVLDHTMSYQFSTHTHQCQDESESGPAPGSGECTSLTSAEYMSLTNRDILETRLRELELHNAPTLCCAPFRASFAHFEFEHLFSQLVREYAAAVLNSRQPGTATTPMVLMHIETSLALLETACGRGFVSVDERKVATALLRELSVYNQRCESGFADTGTVGSANQQQQQPNDQSCSPFTLDKRLCSDGGGVYDRSVGECLCHSNRHPGEPDCAHLSCSGNGASMYDYDKQSEKCVCFENWTGADCSQCAKTTPLNQDHVYHCVGTAQQVYQTDVESVGISQQHYLQLVPRATVRARLSGSYYSSSVHKFDDAVPGTAALDCWCRSTTEKPDWKSLASARDSAIVAMEQYAIMQSVASRSDALLQSALLAEASTSTGSANQGQPSDTLPQNPSNQAQSTNETLKQHTLVLACFIILFMVLV